MSEHPDYTTMSGAEFQRAVGTDPEKWADAFAQQFRQVAAGVPSLCDTPEQIARWLDEILTGWFRDAMDAARAEAHDEILPQP
jgi:hypothetical protein